MRLHRLTAEPEIPMAKKKVLPFFPSAGNLEGITPAELTFKITTPDPVIARVGSPVDNQLRLHGITFIRKRKSADGVTPCLQRRTASRPAFDLVHQHLFPEAVIGSVDHASGQFALPMSTFGNLPLPLVRA